jgi:hydroxypyruvate isomerase
VTFCLENLNTAVDHPGVPFARAADTLALVLDELGHRGTVGLEAWASGDSEHALTCFREAFTVPGTRTGALP